MTIYAVTGHRPDKLGGYDEPAQAKLIRFASHILYGLVNPTDTVLTGMALGWDQAVAHACVRAKIPFVACIPFQGQEMAWPEHSRERYKNYLSKAASVVVVSEGGYAPYKMQVRNEHMVDASEHLIALWNGSTGGTANCVRYALNQKRPMTNVWPGWLSFEH